VVLAHASRPEVVAALPPLALAVLYLIWTVHLQMSKADPKAGSPAEEEHFIQATFKGLFPFLCVVMMAQARDVNEKELTYTLGVE
jgi:hypothetical protein